MSLYLGNEKVEKLDLIDNLTKEMKLAAANLDFERAMSLRDIIFDIESKQLFLTSKYKPKTKTNKCYIF